MSPAAQESGRQHEQDGSRCDPEAEGSRPDAQTLGGREDSPPLQRGARRAGQGRAQSRPAEQSLHVGSARGSAGTPSISSRSSPPRVCPNSFRSGTGACWCRRSPSTVAAPTSWPRTLRTRRCQGLNVQLCGDAHLSNFGGFASAERRMVFDINDFDETLPGPWEWDLKRLATSFEIAGRDRGFSDSKRREAVLEAVRAYREAMTMFAGQRDLDVWYAHLDVEAVLPKIEQAMGSRQSKTLERNLAKAYTKDSMKALGKLTHLVDGQPQYLERPTARGTDRRGVPRDRSQAARDHAQEAPAPVPCEPAERPPRVGGTLQVRRRGSQSRGRRQRGHAGVDPAHARPG